LLALVGSIVWADTKEGSEEFGYAWVFTIIFVIFATGSASMTYLFGDNGTPNSIPQQHLDAIETGEV
jgi:hypothetical protein